MSKRVKRKSKSLVTSTSSKESVGKERKPWSLMIVNREDCLGAEVGDEDEC